MSYFLGCFGGGW